MAKLYVISEKWISEQMTELIEMQEAAIKASDLAKVLFCETKMSAIRQVVLSSKDAETLFRAGWQTRDAMNWEGDLAYEDKNNTAGRSGNEFYQAHVDSFNKQKPNDTKPTIELP